MPPFLVGFLTDIATTAATAAIGIPLRILQTAATGIFGLARMAFGAITNVLMAAGRFILTTLMTIVRGIGQALAAIPGLLMNAVSSLAGLLGHAAEGLIKVGGLALGVAAGGLAAFGAALKLGVTAAMAFAKSANELSATSGKSFGSSGQTIRLFGALGIDAGQVQSSFGGNAALHDMQAQAWGLSGGFSNANFIPDLAREFQRLSAQGMGGQIQANAMADNLGMSSPQQKAVLNLPVEQIEKQIAAVNRMYAAMGVGTSTLQAYATQVPQFANQLAAFWDAIKMKVSVVALPALQNLLGALTDFASANAGKVGQWISDAAEWLYVKAPLLAVQGVATVLGAVSSLVAGAIQVLGYIASNVPVWLDFIASGIEGFLSTAADVIGRYGTIIVNGVADGLTALGGVISGWMRRLGDFLVAIEQDGNPWRTVMLYFADMADNVVYGLKLLAGGLAGFFASVQNLIAVTPLLSAPLRLLGIDVGFTNPYTAAQNAYNMLPQTDMRGMVENATNNQIPNAGRALLNGADTLDATVPNAANAARAIGLGAVDTATSGLGNAAAMVRPIASAIGDVVANGAQAGADFLQNTVAPVVTDTLNTVNNVQRGMGTESERSDAYAEKMIDLMQKQVDATRELVKQGGGGSAFNNATGYAVAQVALNEAMTIRRFGG